MSKSRLTSTAREKELELAIARIKRGRAKSKETRISFASVAREAGVSTALIHNHYPQIAELIREAQSRSSRAQRDAKHVQLKTEREKNRLLRAEVGAMRIQISKLASVNEVLLIENRDLKARQDSSNVISVGTKDRS